MFDDYKERWMNCLAAIEYTLSQHGCEDWLRQWVEGEESAEAELKAWIDGGKL